MNRATPSTGWVRNPDGTLGWTLNIITGCLNRTPEGLCLGGMFPCYAYKLANGRLRDRYRANSVLPSHDEPDHAEQHRDPFYPRFWPVRLQELWYRIHSIEQGHTVKPRGIFPCDMSDWCGIGIPYEWSADLMVAVRADPLDRFYLLTKQPQNLLQFSPFPGNCWVGVTATGAKMAEEAGFWLWEVKAGVKFVSFEPLLERIPVHFTDYISEDVQGINWVIIGAQTKPKKLPEWEWVQEIIEAADRAGIPVFLKDNLGLPKYNYAGAAPFYKKHPTGTMELRQELPKCQ